MVIDSAKGAFKTKTQVPPLGDRQLEFAAVSSSISVLMNAANVLVHFSLFFFRQK
jgi:hypothetical protein